jgi:hypothetical protein
MQRVMNASFAIAVFLMLLPAAALAQEGQIAGTIRDASGAVMPGVLVEVTSPALIEKTRSTTSDDSGQYRITNLPVGTYSITFTLEGFSKQQRDDIVLTSGFTAPINAVMAVGQQSETVTVVAAAPTVDVQNARQVASFQGEQLRELPSPHNLNTLLTLTPGITAATGGNTAWGADCVGGAGTWCNQNLYALGTHTDPNDQTANLQGRILVDGSVINAGSAGGMGLTGGYAVDVSASQEVTIQISGALGESETGGATINIVPRTGGNRFAGDYFTSYTRNAWFDKNNGTHTNVTVVNAIRHDHDVSGSYGGPIRRDHLWFFAAARYWGKESNPGNEKSWDNKNTGIWGMNYQPDRVNGGPLTFTNLTHNFNTRITYQATARNKFNIFWDEGYTCQDPCNGTVSANYNRDGGWSGTVSPARLAQVTWTNPFTDKLLLEGGVSVNMNETDFSKHNYFPSHKEVPRIVEFGTTVGADEVAPVVNGIVQTGGMASGAWNNGIGEFGRWLDYRDIRPRASASYVSGTHNAKVGFEAGFYSQDQFNAVNDSRWTYRYDTPVATCYNAANPAASTCGNTSLYFPSDPYNRALRPVPTRMTINTGPTSAGSRVNYQAFYLQDMWTLKRVTLSGALRYDHATSHYVETCVGPDPYVPVQIGGQFAGQNKYCSPATDGVSYNDISPRWGLAWDVFGTGRTSVKWNMGRYLNAANIGGIYSGLNPGTRSIQQYERLWTDVDGDRVPDCDLLNFNPNGECFGPSGVTQDSVRYGRDPFSLADSGQAIGLNTVQCGLQSLDFWKPAISNAVQSYCNAYGDSLLDGSGKRRTEWQFTLGVQHEILPRLSAEVTYNRRYNSKLTVNDQLGVGCDRFNGAVDLPTCLNNQMNYVSGSHDFFTVTAPGDPNLPGGGGYTVRGLANQKPTLPNGLPTAVTIFEVLDYVWSGVDTNFVWRGPRGLRMNGGTSTGRALRDQCGAELNAPNIKARDGNSPACNPATRIETQLRGSVAYTIPWADLLASAVFQWRPGIPYAANMTVSKDAVAWDPSSASRATLPCTGAQAGQTGCFVPTGTTVTATTYVVNLLDPGDIYGEGYSIVDLKFAKNIRFADRRLSVGVDVYNLFNNDAIRAISTTYPATAAGVAWGTPTGLLSPRFARLQVQFNF